MSTTQDLIFRIRDQVRDHAKKYDNEVYVRSAINPIIREMEKVGLTRTRTASFVTVATQADYPFATTAGLLTLGTIHWVERLSLGTEKKPLFWRDRYTNAGDTSSSEPTHWTAWAAGLQLSPTPSSIVSIQVDAFCSPLLATGVAPATDELQLAADVEDVLVDGASARMARLDAEYQKEARYQILFSTGVSRLRAQLNPDRGDLPSIEDGSGLDSYIEDV